MKTYIFVRDIDQAVIEVGMIYYESGDLDETVQPFVDSLGLDAGILAYANILIALNGYTGITPRVVDTADLPGGNGGLGFDKTLYRITGKDDMDIEFDYCGWTDSIPGSQVDIDMVNPNGAKAIGHLYRRVHRERLLAPLDKEERYASTTPARRDEIVLEKQAILNDNAATQTAIDAATTEAELRAALAGAGIPLT